MQVELLHYNFKLQADKVDSLRRRDFLGAEIDEFLNQAQIMLIRQMYSGNHRQRLAYEQAQQITDFLAGLTVKQPTNTTPCLSPKAGGTVAINDRITMYEFVLPNPQYMHFVSASALLADCSADVIITTHDRLQPTLKDPYMGPSAKWARVVGVFARESQSTAVSGVRDRSIFIYSEVPVLNLCVEYLRMPVTITIGGYPDINGATRVKTECELPASFHNQLVDLAVMIAQGVVENPQGYQIASQKLQINN